MKSEFDATLDRTMTAIDKLAQGVLALRDEKAMLEAEVERLRALLAGLRELLE